MAVLPLAVVIDGKLREVQPCLASAIVIRLRREVQAMKRLSTLLRYLLVLGLALGFSRTARADDPATVGARIAASLTGGSSTDAAVVSLKNAVVSSATALLPKLTANGSFSDIDYTGAPAANWGVGTHFSRVLTLAQAYQIQGGTLYHSPTLLTSIQAALTYGTGAAYYCGAASCVTGNWWWWQIGVPLDLGPTLILMQGPIDASTIASLTAKLSFHIGDDAAMTALTGENELWVALGHIYVAVLSDSIADASAIEAAVQSTAAVNSGSLGDGIKPDESFQFHGGQLYTGGYGSDYAGDIMTYLGLTDGTVFGLPSSAVTQAVDYIADGVAWCVYDSYFDPAVRGREITRPESGPAPLEAFVPAALASSPIQSELQAYAKELVTERGTGGLDIVTQAEQVKSLPVTAAFPSGHRHFPSSDYTVHRRSSSFVSIKMLSTRTKSGELVNGEGLQGARQSDGKLYLVLKGDEYLGGPNGKGLWPAVDWTRLPGITVMQNGNAASTDYGIGTEAFVGGTSDGQNGVSAMVLAPIGGTLHAKKSWFFFEGYIVFLANSITATAAAPVETIVEQWPLSSETVPVMADGMTVATGAYSATLPMTHWMAADGLGYFFPGGSSVDVVVKEQTGDWSSLGVSSGSVSAPFLTLALEHGNAPTNATAAYAITTDGQDMSTFAASPPFSVIQNDATVSAVAGQGAAGAVFWSAANVTLLGTMIASDTPAVVWLSSSGTTTTLSVADPAQGAGTIHVTVSGAFKSAAGGDPGITVALTGANATLSVDRAGGVTHTATLSTVTQQSTPDGGAPDAAHTGDAGHASSGPDAGKSERLDAAVQEEALSGTVGAAHGCSCRVADEPRWDGTGPASALGLMGAFLVRRRRRLTSASTTTATMSSRVPTPLGRRRSPWIAQS
jgi:MYXO-CTERM domain-containing protein